MIVAKKKFLFRVPENRGSESQEEGLGRTTLQGIPARFQAWHARCIISAFTNHLPKK